MCDDVYNTRYGFIIPDEHIPSDEEMNKYAQGDESIIPTLVEGVTRHIVNQIEWFLSKTPSARPFREDCISEGLLALQIFTMKELGREYTPSKFLAFAKSECLHKIEVWLREMSIAVTIPKSTQYRNKVKMQQTKLTDEMKSTRGDSLFNEIWFKEFMDNLDGFDQEIIQLKIEGKSNSEIGRTIGVSHVTVQMHLDRLAEFYSGENK